MQILDRINAVAEATSIDLTPATRDLALMSERSAAFQKLDAARADALAASVNRLLRAPIDEIPDAWGAVVNAHANDAAWEARNRTVSDQLGRFIAKAQARAAWDALGLLTNHVKKMGKELAELAAHPVDTPDDAINSGKVKEFGRFNQIAAELEQISTLPELPERQKDSTLIIIRPPEIVQYRNPEHPNPDDRDKAPHTEVEQRDHEHARAHAQADTFTARLLTAARNGWDITPALSIDDYTNRRTQIIHGVSYVDAIGHHLPASYAR